VSRGLSFPLVPTSWTNRAAGDSKLALDEMGSRYLFIVLYVFLEQHLSRGDYRRPPRGEIERPARIAIPEEGGRERRFRRPSHARSRRG
jgi:dolichol-phosphate mannosyltransferase